MGSYMPFPTCWSKLAGNIHSTDDKQTPQESEKFDFQVHPDDNKTCLLLGNWGQRSTGCKIIWQEQKDHLSNCCRHQSKLLLGMLVLKRLSLVSPRLIWRQFSKNLGTLFHQPTCRLGDEKAAMLLLLISVKNRAERSACWWHCSLITQPWLTLMTYLVRRAEAQLGWGRLEEVLIICCILLLQIIVALSLHPDYWQQVISWNTFKRNKRDAVEMKNA